jgi:hypothetical protein
MTKIFAKIYKYCLFRFRKKAKLVRSMLNNVTWWHAILADLRAVFCFHSVFAKNMCNTGADERHGKILQFSRKNLHYCRIPNLRKQKTDRGLSRWSKQIKANSREQNFVQFCRVSEISHFLQNWIKTFLFQPQLQRKRRYRRWFWFHAALT